MIHANPSQLLQEIWLGRVSGEQLDLSCKLRCLHDLFMDVMYTYEIYSIKIIYVSIMWRTIMKAWMRFKLGQVLWIYSQVLHCPSYLMPAFKPNMYCFNEQNLIFFTRGNHPTISIILMMDSPYPVDHHPNRMYSEIRMAPIGSRYTSSDTWYCSYILLEPDPHQKAKLYIIFIIKCYTNQKKLINI